MEFREKKTRIAGSGEKTRANRPAGLTRYADRSDFEIETWFERDRAHVELRDRRTDQTVIEWWDENVQEAVDDGFLDPRDWLGSALDYATRLGMIRESERGRPRSLRRRYRGYAQIPPDNRRAALPENRAPVRRYVLSLRDALEDANDALDPDHQSPRHPGRR